MSFFEKKLNSLIINSLPPLIIKLFRCVVSKKVLMQKRTSPFTLLPAASMTLEAAVVFPMFLAACMMILFFAELFRLETRVSELLFNSSKVYAQYAGLLMKDEESDNVFYEAGLKGFGIYEAANAFKEELGEGFNDEFLMAKGNMSYSFGYSRIDENYVDLIVVYRVKFNVPFISLPEIPIVQRCRFRIWSGRGRTKQADSDDIIVYIALNGQVYHKDRDCTYIKLTINSVKYSEINSKRNNGGGKYYACEKCIKKNSVNDVVYITDNGTRYHNSINCSELKRTVREVKLSEVKDSKRPCSKCGS